jgi:membrane-bound ClpP family serine protease
MNAIIILFLLGIILLVFEVVMPGAVLGILGGLSMVGGCIVAFNLYGAGGGSVATLVALAILGLALYVEFVLLPRTRLGKMMFVHSVQTATSQPPVAADSVVGKTAEALTTLAPTGFVLVEGKRYEAFCRSGHVEKGASLRVAGLDNFRLIVTKP